MELLLRNLRHITKKITEEENNVPLYQKPNQVGAEKPPIDDPNG